MEEEVEVGMGVGLGLRLGLGLGLGLWLRPRLVELLLMGEEPWILPPYFQKTLLHLKTEIKWLCILST